MPCDAGRNADEARRALAADRRPGRRADRAAPRSLLRPGALEPPRLGRGARRPVHRRCHRRHRRLRLRGPIVRRTPFRAGVIKVAGSEGGPSDRDRRVFEAAAQAHRRTGVPILTHCEDGTGALEQIRLLRDHGVAARHIVLSHVDKVVDRGYHRELLASGALRRVRRLVPLAGRRAERDVAAHPLDGRGWARRADRPRDGRRAPSLLPRLWRRTRAGLVARRFRSAARRRRHGRVGSPSTVRDQPGAAFAFAPAPSRPT